MQELLAYFEVFKPVFYSRINVEILIDCRSYIHSLNFNCFIYLQLPIQCLNIYYPNMAISKLGPQLYTHLYPALEYQPFSWS